MSFAVQTGSHPWYFQGVMANKNGRLVQRNDYFYYRNGTCRFEVMPFDLMNAPPTLQRMMYFVT